MKSIKSQFSHSQVSVIRQAPWKVTPFPEYDFIAWKMTKYCAQKFNAKLTSHYFRKRFATIANNTAMPADDWDFIMGSKMQVGHNADIYQLEDLTTLKSKYGKFLEPLFGFDNTQPTDEPLTEVQRLQQLLQQKDQTIAVLTSEIERLQSLVSA